MVIKPNINLIVLTLCIGVILHPSISSFVFGTFDVIGKTLFLLILLFVNSKILLNIQFNQLNIGGVLLSALFISLISIVFLISISKDVFLNQLFNYLVFLLFFISSFIFNLNLTNLIKSSIYALIITTTLTSFFVIYLSIS